MIRCSKCLTFILLILLFAIKGAAQKKDSLQMGELSGILKDIVRNYVIQSATVAVYKPNDSKLLAYGLTNKSGQFIIKGIPVGTKLNFKASHIGYKTYLVVGNQFVLVLPNKPTRTSLITLIIVLLQIQLSIGPKRFIGTQMLLLIEAFPALQNQLITPFGMRVWYTVFLRETMRN